MHCRTEDTAPQEHFALSFRIGRRDALLDMTATGEVLVQRDLVSSVV